ncbi:MAG TPA: hypothetical protein VHA13_05210 [Gammaproteobacteria bacterium]|nr:hypothetical protein [Gammaproteobacteria bacterium]
MLKKISYGVAGGFLGLLFSLIYIARLLLNLASSFTLYLILVADNLLGNLWRLGKILFNGLAGLLLAAAKTLTFNPLMLVVNIFDFVFTKTPSLLWKAGQAIVGTLIGAAINFALNSYKLLKDITATVLLCIAGTILSTFIGIIDGFRACKLPKLYGAIGISHRPIQAGPVRPRLHHLMNNNLPFDRAVSARETNENLASQINNLKCIKPGIIKSLQLDKEKLEALANDPSKQAELKEYQTLNEDLKCSISIENFSDLNIPLTIEYENNNQWHTKVFECSDMITWIKSQRFDYATLPEGRIELSSRSPWKDENGILKSTDGKMKIFKGIGESTIAKLQPLVEKLNQSIKPVPKGALQNNSYSFGI